MRLIDELQAKGMLSSRSQLRNAQRTIKVIISSSNYPEVSAPHSFIYLFIYLKPGIILRNCLKLACQ